MKVRVNPDVRTITMTVPDGLSEDEIFDYIYEQLEDTGILEVDHFTYAVVQSKTAAEPIKE